MKNGVCAILVLAAFVPATSYAEGPSCSDSILGQSERCNDGNLVAGDGCSETCELEDGWICPSPGVPCVERVVCGSEIECSPFAACESSGGADACVCNPGYVSGAEGPTFVVCDDPNGLVVAASDSAAALSSATAGEGVTITAGSEAYVGGSEAAGTFAKGPMGLGSGILLTSGSALLASGPNELSGMGKENQGAVTEALCSDILPGGDFYDATKLTFEFDLAEGYDGIGFRYLFGSEEYPDFVSAGVNDVAGVFLDGVNIGLDAYGNPITVDGPFFSGNQVIVSSGTEYDGATPLLSFCKPVLPGHHKIEVVVCDTGDPAFDSGIFLSKIAGYKGECAAAVHWCGDGNTDADEECDDGNSKPGDGCSTACTIEVEGCGDGMVADEACDDGNNNPFDGCDGACNVEEGWSCTADAGAKSVCTKKAPAGVCGDGNLDDGEECDDENTEPGDGCDAECRIEVPVCGACEQCGEACGLQCPAGYTCSATGLCESDTLLQVVASDDASALAQALVVPSAGITVSGSAYAGSACQSGTFTHGPLKIEDGVLVTTGAVVNALPPDDVTNKTTMIGALSTEPYCKDLSGEGAYYDVAKLSVTFDLAAGYKGVRFGFVFASEEFPEFITSPFNDAAGVFVDGANYAKDQDGNKISITGPFFNGTQVVTQNGTQYNGATPFLSYCVPLEPGVHTLDVVICDMADANYDSGIFVSRLAGVTEPCGDAKPHWCGDQVQDADEECDDGNSASGDGCSSDCRLEAAPTCGNSIHELGEACDDGNQTDGDGCSASCAVIECGFTCETGIGIASVCATTCGDGLVAAGIEDCDDGNTDVDDGCDDDCKVEEGYECASSECAAKSTCAPVVAPVCGDGVKAGAEACDDGNSTAEDGCDATCAIETGWECVEDAYKRSTCTRKPVVVCGDVVDAGEACDDGNTAADDGCDPTCKVETGWTCTAVAGTKSECSKKPVVVCGDVVDAGEACDDGNTAADDGCDPTCKVETGWTCTAVVGTKSECSKGECADGDEDGVCDDLDNCPAVANADQQDWDGNGVGNACEPAGLAYEFSGGGCSATPGAGGGSAGLIVLMGLALLAFLGLRRARTSFRGGAAGLIVAASFATASPATADTIDVQAFRPSPFVQDLFTVQTGQTKGPCLWSAGLYLNYQSDPFVLRAVRGGSDPIIRKIVEHQLTANLLASYSFADWFALGIDVPVVLWQAGQTLPGMAKAGAFGMGDIFLYPKFRLVDYRDGTVTLGLTPTLIVPVGGFIDDYMGRKNIAFLPTVELGVNLGRGGFAVNAGVLYSLSKSEIANIDVTNQLKLKAGGWVGLIDKKLDLIAEASVGTPLTQPFGDVNELPVEVGGGVTWHAAPGVDVNLGASGAVTKGVAAPVYRVFSGVQLFCEKKAPPKPVCDADPDGDRICSPCVAEQKREAEFAAVCQGTDQCPADPEDFDSFEDADGCPDPDNDKDGICDPWVAAKGLADTYKDICRLSDKCPDVPEDKDGFEDDDGCPECDNDKDKICDPWVTDKDLQGLCAGCKPSDKCPDQPENYNGYQDDDGCPDKAVQITKKQVIILQEVLFFFDKTTIKPESFPLLDEVVETLKENPQLKKLELQAHTDERGRKAYNLKLSQGRAKAVYDYCVSKGIDAKRLTSRGFGASQPLVKGAKTEDDHQKNRRVVFKILEQD